MKQDNEEKAYSVTYLRAPVVNIYQNTLHDFIAELLHCIDESLSVKAGVRIPAILIKALSHLVFCLLHLLLWRGL